MNKFAQFVFILSAILLFNTSCEKTDPKSGESPNQYVNDWIYEQMNIYYYWNDKLPRKPDYTQNPEQFFKSLLYTYNQSNPDGDRFSHIQENYIDLLNSLGGVTSDEIGFEYILLNVSPVNTPVKQYYLLVLYPKLNTDAQKKGIKRGHFIVQIDGQNITENNYRTLLSGTGSKKLTITTREYNTTTGEYKFSPNTEDITVEMHSQYAENPIYLDTVFTDKKIGYLVYNFFAKDKGDDTYAYDKALMSSLETIRSKGAEEFILDLRYNGGGDVASAIALASALVKNRSTQNLLVSTEFNPIVHSAFERQYGKGYNKDYFIDKIKNNKQQVMAEVPALSLPRLYVLVSRFTASASELIINGLKPYMEVILIGEPTVGKNVGSFVLYEENDPKNKWGILPITFKYFNSQGDSDFSTGFQPDYAESEFEDFILADFGSVDDKFLNAALTHITTNTMPMSSFLRSRAKFDSGLNLEVMKNSESMKINQMYDSRYSPEK